MVRHQADTRNEIDIDEADNAMSATLPLQRY